jgi:hypothetical protein
MPVLVANVWKFIGMSAVARVDFGVVGEEGSIGCFVRDNGPWSIWLTRDKLFVPVPKPASTGGLPCDQERARDGASDCRSSWRQDLGGRTLDSDATFSVSFPKATMDRRVR